MIDNAILYLKGQVQPLPASFQKFHDPQALLVVGKMPSKLCHHGFAGMAKGSVAHIMAQGNGLSQIFIKAQSPGNRTGNLRYF